MRWKPDASQIIAGTEHKTLEDAIAADLFSAVPILGAVTDFLRVLDSDTRPQKALQVVDMLTEPIPIFNVVTPTNTLLFLDKKGFLPVPLEELDKPLRKLTSKRRA